MDSAEKPIQLAETLEDSTNDPASGILVNASGHPQELDRNFGLLSICGLAITTGNTWLGLGGSIVVAISNGGPPGVIYELIAVSIFYWLIAASIAELASAIPSAGGVYHWASITAGRYGRVCGWFAGWWNFLAWIFGLAATSQIVGAQAVSMYALFHPGFEVQRWQVFVAYLICTWLCCSIVLFANKILPKVEYLGGFLTVAGVVLTILVCAIMPRVNGTPYATNRFVWRDWQNATGYKSDGFVFLLGMLNGAFSVGAPDIISHLAEEVPRPSVNLPKAILAQYVTGFLTALCYLIGIFYSTSDLASVVESTYLFPLAEIYRQTTGSAGGALGLLILCLLPTIVAVIGCFLTVSRIFWTLARDDATPFSGFFGRVNRKHRNPSNSIILCAAICTILGCIYLGSATAFGAFVGSFIILSTLSYLAAILPHLLSKRSRVIRGWFWMKGPIGFAVNGISCLYIVTFIIIFSFPFSMPVTAATMNYACLTTGGLSLFVLAFWFSRQRHYVGPRAFRP